MNTALLTRRPRSSPGTGPARLRSLGPLLLALLGPTLFAAEPATAIEVKRASLQGNLDGDRARLVIEADLGNLGPSRAKAIYGAALEQLIRVSRDRLDHTIGLHVEALEGGLREIVLTLGGTGEVRQVTSDGLEDWSVRQAGDQRFLVLRLAKSETPVKTFAAQLRAETLLTGWPATVSPLTLTTESPTLAHGFVRIVSAPAWSVQLANPSGVVPVEIDYLPPSLRPADLDTTAEPLAFRFHGTTYSLPLELTVADPEARQVTLRDFHLTGRLEDQRATFNLRATARVKNPRGGRLDLLRGGVALSQLPPLAGGRLRFGQGAFVLEYDAPGDFPIDLEFHATVRPTDGWQEVDFGVAPSALQPVAFPDLPADTEFRFAGAARPEREATGFRSFLPPTGQVKLAWKAGRPEAEGRLFYAVEGLSQVTVSPGLLRQTTVLDFKVMQGELNRVTCRLKGEGEITRVQGPSVLSWTLEPPLADGTRRLVIALNAAQRDQFSLALQMQRTLGAFPQGFDAAQLVPEEATRFGGFVRVVNEGAVRLEVLNATGLSQISPEQIPQTDTTRALLPAQSTQAFAYRFSGPDYQLRVQADNILPELAVSQVLAYHLGETELTLEAELELDIREAPLREVLLRIPAGFTLASLNAPGSSDHFTTDSPGTAQAQLRVVYAQPVTGRQVIQLRLERNQPFRDPRWSLPRLEVLQARSTRGHVGVSADEGFRLTPATTQGLTELATAFFPKKLAGIQAAYRLTDPDWEATLNVERLPQAIQADVFHLFSVGEGIAYGSSVVNYTISGAPVSVFRFELSDEYANVEFTGKNVRAWQRTTNGFQVQLHQAVSGTYTLLATYDRSFKAQGDQLAFTGARPLEAQSEQGYTVVISTYQFHVQTVNVSPSLTALEPGEVPAEYRLFFDAPILAAYRYTARPFNLELALKPLAQGEMLSQVVDRAALTTRISEEGQVVTDARYFVKNKGTPHLRLELPADTELWAVTVNSNPVVPVKDERANLIPLPQHADPNTLNEVAVSLAAKATHARHLTLTAPAVSAPVLLLEWQLTPDRGHRLDFRRGTLTPLEGWVDPSGFAGLLRLFTGPDRARAWTAVLATLALIAIARFGWRACLHPASSSTATPRPLRRFLAGLASVGAAVLVVLMLFQLMDWAREDTAQAATDLRFLAPVQPSDSTLRVELTNLPLTASAWTQFWRWWPAWFAVAAWLYSLATPNAGRRPLATALGWGFLAWAVLRQPHGAPLFFGLALVFLLAHLLLPSLRQWWLAARTAPAAASAALLACLLVPLLPTNLNAQPTPGRTKDPGPAQADQVASEVRVEEDFVFGTARIRWQARQGQTLPLLREPGVLTQLETGPAKVRLVTGTEPAAGQIGGRGRRQQALLAEADGWVEATLTYEARVSARDAERGFALPTHPGLVNPLTLTVVGRDVEVLSPNAVSVQRTEDPASTNTVAQLILSPTADAWIAWKPRSRDPRREKAVFYAELFQLYVPGGGVVEGLHSVQIRPAQGELTELFFDIPAGATITDVNAPTLSVWRFDPDARRLRVALSSAQARPFAVLIQSQSPTGPLPLDHAVGLISVRGAADQVGLLGVATGNEVQLEDVNAGSLAVLNLEDFPAAVLEPLRAVVPGLTLRRAFRYATPDTLIRLQASAVEPDVRVESQQTLSLGEDRTLLATTLNVAITRAGLFKLTFPLPAGLEVESLSGPALSHWTELRTDTGRIITLHLKGKTEGDQSFTLTLAGPGVRATNGWSVPRLVLREAQKQRGQFLVVPEQGLRLQVAQRDGVTQLDPAQAGVRQKGVLAFRLLQSDWQLALDLERVDAWIQLTSLQDVTVGEAQLKVFANLQYEIENTGVRGFRVRLPANAENVRFRGEQVADFIAAEAPATADARDWEVKLHRRMLGRYLLQLNYTVPVPVAATELTVRGIQALDVNLQRGFFTVQAGGRLQVRSDDPPPALQPTEWQVIPRALQQDLPAAAADYTFRLVEPDVRLPLRLERFEAARLLPARVTRVDLKSVIADDGVMLTHAQLELVPGDKRLLHVRLPQEARFWFAFVNQSGVWPWHDQDEVLIPLEKPAAEGQATRVEFFFTSRPGRGSARALDLNLDGPRFDLPLERITWQVFLSRKWHLDDWQGTLQLEEAALATPTAPLDLGSYLSNETILLRQQTQQAEQYLNLGNRLLESGDTLQARRAFQNAYGLSQHDAAFNEDARVQLQNLKMQQAIVGLNFRQAKVAGEPSAPTPRRGTDEALNYTQQQASEILARNTAEDNAVQLRFAERLIQQQDAAVASPAALRATLPDQGRVLTFTRPLEVNRWAELRLELEASSSPSTSFFLKALVLGATFILALALILLGRTRPSTST
jgi:hypothetical protein